MILFTHLPYPFTLTLIILYSIPSTFNALTGVETTLITVAPSAPCLDLLPGWESQHLESWFSVHNQINIPEWEENVGNDRIVSLCLRKGEDRVENIYAVLQPLLTGVWGNGQNTCTSDRDKERKKIEMEKKEKYEDRNNDGSESENECVNNSWCDVEECALDSEECSIAEDMRITIHSWSKPMPTSTPNLTSTSTSTSSPRGVTTNIQSDEFRAEYIDDMGVRNLSSRSGFSPVILTKNSSLLRDFLGPLKSDITKQKVNPYPPCEMTCKLLTEENNLDSIKGIKNNAKNGILNNGNIGDNSYTDLNSLNALPSSLSLPLSFNFQYNPTVVAYRLDVETLARNSTNLSENKNEKKSSADVHSQIYLRRYVMSYTLRLFVTCCELFLSCLVFVVLE